MNRGFYTLGSGMLTSNRSLNAISNNLANAMTTGFKKSQIVSSTFGEMMMYRLEDAPEAIGPVTMMRTATESACIHSQGVLKSAERALDMAISGSGFFAVQTEDGVAYTRKGAFSIDAQGYLTLGGVGRVLGADGPIYLGTADIEGAPHGNIDAGAASAGKIQIYDFDDYNDLVFAGEGFYVSPAAAPYVNGESKIYNKTLEASNVDAASEMTDAMIEQRSLQACASALRMYDENLSKAVAEIGRI